MARHIQVIKCECDHKKLYIDRTSAFPLAGANKGRVSCQNLLSKLSCLCMYEHSDIMRPLYVWFRDSDNVFNFIDNLTL